MATDDISDPSDEDIIRNEDTRRRRAWVDRAVESARRRLAQGEEIPAAPDKPERPRLAVVPTARKR